MDLKTKFLGYRVEESVFKMNPLKENAKFALSPKFTCTIAGGKERFSSTLIVELNEETSSGGTPFNLKVALKGEFFIGADVGEDKQKQLKVAVSALFPFLRAFVSTLTVSCGFPPFLLPMIDVDVMAANLKSEQVIYS
ncbi:MAG: protein-export chaperone SecB [Clostridia bacterium]|nr:protein-export chaperone SecB [Clostridia bacterium]